MRALRFAAISVDCLTARETVCWFATKKRLAPCGRLSGLCAEEGRLSEGGKRCQNEPVSRKVGFVVLGVGKNP